MLRVKAWLAHSSVWSCFPSNDYTSATAHQKRVTSRTGFTKTPQPSTRQFARGVPTRIGNVRATTKATEAQDYHRL
jgi:hypothetical protein